jgi:hypothetical protein
MYVGTDYWMDEAAMKKEAALKAKKRKVGR